MGPAERAVAGDEARRGLRAQAEAWLADDPDPATRAELRALLDLADPADRRTGPADHLADRRTDRADHLADLAERFAGPLRFGTAGLRGPLRAGPNGMNRAVVRAATAGLAAWLAAREAAGPVVVGYDARHGSAAFAEETTRVLTGAGRTALLLPGPLPTPVLAHAVQLLGATAGVMVTASHNPPGDNGYKVFLGGAVGGAGGDGAQLSSPADVEIEAEIRRVGPLCEIQTGDVGARLGEDIVDSYLAGAVDVIRPGPRELKIAYTAMHGVGAATFTAALARAGFAAPLVVAEQIEPDPAFPTVPFPNPEEPGAMDRVIRLARVCRADLAIAHDPDADRCAAAVDAGPTGWRMLRGDELGVLLADHLIRRGTRGRFATTVVSSTLLSRLCAARGVPYGETLTGFKWIVRAGTDLVYGYEEALGYCVAPAHVRDKDGITAGLLACELAAGLKAAGQTLRERLDELAAEFGVHATEQLAVRFDDLGRIDAAMAHIRRQPPGTLLDKPTTSVEDLLPDADVLVLRAERTRIVVRPSGTEPKLKAYLEVVEPVVGGDVTTARRRAADRLAVLREEAVAALGL